MLMKKDQVIACRVWNDLSFISIKEESEVLLDFSLFGMHHSIRQHFFSTN